MTACTESHKSYASIHEIKSYSFLGLWERTVKAFSVGAIADDIGLLT